MYEDVFISLGLNEAEAEIYDLLVQKGEKTVKGLTKLTDISRTNIYNVLDSLEEKGLIEQIKKQKKTYFQPLHPNKLESLLADEEKELKKAKLELSANLPAIVSDYNLAVGKPGVRFYEGLDGIKKVLEDSLTSKEEILTYADIESIVKYIDDINKAYVKKRDKLGIKKRAILLDTPFARKYLKDYYKKVTDIKLIKYDAPPFQTVMQIYDNKISYITLTEKNMIGVIVEDENIYKMHKYIFEYLWKTAPTVKV